MASRQIISKRLHCAWNCTTRNVTSNLLNRLSLCTRLSEGCHKHALCARIAQINLKRTTIMSRLESSTSKPLSSTRLKISWVRQTRCLPNGAIWLSWSRISLKLPRLSEHMTRSAKSTFSKPWSNQVRVTTSLRPASASCSMRTYKAPKMPSRITRMRIRRLRQVDSASSSRASSMQSSNRNLTSWTRLWETTRELWT